MLPNKLEGAGAEDVGAGEVGLSAVLFPKLKPLPEDAVLFPPPNRLDPPPAGAPPKLKPLPEPDPAPDVEVLPKRLAPEDAGVLPVL